MVSKSKKVICLLMALLCMFTVFSDALTPKAEAIEPITATAAAIGTTAQLLLYAGITAVTCVALYELANNYFAEAAPEIQNEIIDISDYLESGGNDSNGKQKPPNLNFATTAGTIAGLKKLCNVVEDIKEYFSIDDNGDGSIEISTDEQTFDGLIFSGVDYNALWNGDYTTQENLELAYNDCSYSFNDAVSVSIGDFSYEFKLESYESGSYYLLINNELCYTKEGRHQINLGIDYTAVSAKAGFSHIVDVRYGFYNWNNTYICPMVVCKYANSSGQQLYYGMFDMAAFGVLDYVVELIESGSQSMNYNEHKPLDSDALRTYLKQQEALDEPTIKPATIPFPYPWIIVEPDGDVVVNPDVDENTQLVPITPTQPEPTPNPDEPDEPEPSETPSPTPTPEVMPPLFPTWHDYDEWRRQLFRDIGLDPDTVIAPNTTTDPDDATEYPTPDPAAPVEPDVPYKPNIDGMPDIGGTWDYVKDFLADALIWMKLWFSGFVLLPPPIQTSLWALLVITVVLGLLKVFLQ